MSNQEVVKYILDTYPEYIDNLRIVDLKNALLINSNMRNIDVFGTVRTIM